MCVLKTHVDIFDQWDDAIVQQLQALAEKHGALVERCKIAHLLVHPCMGTAWRSVC